MANKCLTNSRICPKILVYGVFGVSESEFDVIDREKYPTRPWTILKIIKI